MKKRLGIALRRYLFTEISCKDSAKYFGCSREFLRVFLRAQLGRMHWIGYGKTWCIGHTLPIHVFGSTTVQLKQCWNWANLRVVPIELRRDNLSYQQARELFVQLHNDMLSLNGSGKNGSFPDTKQLEKLMAKSLTLVLKQNRPKICFKKAWKMRHE